MSTIDELLGREYDRQSSNCLHFAAEAWEALTGDSRLRQVREDDFKAGKLAALFRGYRRVPGPTVTPSIVLMQTLEREAHIAICYRRRMLHSSELGPTNLPFDAMAPLYRNMRFYA